MSESKGQEMASTPNTRKAKIVCTIGPASSSEAVLRDLMRAGMDVARPNFSHGTPEEHAPKIRRLRRGGEKKSRPHRILQDPQRPKIRTRPLQHRTPAAINTARRR